MAIIINSDVMLAKRKMSVTELSQKVGITMANLSILKNEKAKAIRLSTLDAICKVLNSQPGDLLEYQNKTNLDNEIFEVNTGYQRIKFYLALIYSFRVLMKN